VGGKMEVGRTFKETGKLSTRALAKKLGIARSSLYYKPKRPKIDEEVKIQIEGVMIKHSSYGHKRIALELKLGKNRVLRVMKKFGLKPARRRIRKPRKSEDEGKAPIQAINITKILCPIRISVVWVSDFTYIKYKTIFIYVATIMDMYTREIVGWHISRFHNVQLTIGAFIDAMNNKNYQPPHYLHSDQGSEYEAKDYEIITRQFGVIQSFSDKGSPWQNGFQEAFYSQFKVDLGDPNRFEILGELIAEIHEKINYYNKERIHTTLKMTPQAFRTERLLDRKNST
jgi:putative transposase